MCSDHEVAEFTWNHDRQAVTGKTHVLDAAHAPLMATDPSGNITRDRLSSWFKNRGIPDFRPDAADRLRAVGYPSAASLMASGFGASLSDQYWIRPAGSASTWRDVNCFENDFSEELGELLLPHDASSVPSLIEKIRGNADLLASSPDAALNGNLPKRWTIEGGQRMLVKSGAILRQVPGTVQREDRQRPVLAAARRGRLCRLRARGRRLHEVDLPLQTHDRPGHRVRAGLGAALLVETPLGPRAARFLRVRLRRPRARRARGRGEDARHRLPHGELR